MDGRVSEVMRLYYRPSRGTTPGCTSLLVFTRDAFNFMGANFPSRVRGFAVGTGAITTSDSVFFFFSCLLGIICSRVCVCFQNHKSHLDDTKIFTSYTQQRLTLDVEKGGWGAGGLPSERSASKGNSSRKIKTDGHAGGNQFEVIDLLAAAVQKFLPRQFPEALKAKTDQ